MKISDILTYKVVECGEFMAVVPSNQRIADRDCIELIISNMPTCCEYLARYTYERAAGREPIDAHQSALKGAQVLASGGLDRARLQS